MKFNKSWIAVIAVSQILAACTDGMQKNMSAVRIAPNAPTEGSGQGQMNEQMGTGDGGGGNAINFKMLESYMFDPNELAVVRTRVSPLLKRLFPPVEDLRDAESDIAEVKEKKEVDIFSYKNWYLAPINLKVIPKDVLGIEFTEKGHQQVAIQTRQAIWIDSNIFSKMDDEEKVRLIVHEIMMMAYLTRFDSIADLCKLSQRAGGEGCSGADFDSVEAPEARRALESKDYEIIRNMTAWVLKNEMTVTEEDYQKYSKRIGFNDPRFTYGSINAEQLTVDESAILEALRAAYHSGALDPICKTEKLGLETPCELRFEKKENSILEVFLISPETQKVLHRASVSLYKDMQLTFDVEGKAIVASAFPGGPQDGERFSNFQFLFSKEVYGKRLRLEQIVVTPVVVATGEVREDGLCLEFRTERLYPNDLTSDKMILKRKDVERVTRIYDPSYSGCLRVVK